MPYYSKQGLIRNDFVTTLVLEKESAAENLYQSSEECESVIQSLSEAGDWIGVAGVGRFLSGLWPQKTRGYLAQFDGLFNLGLRLDASIVTEIATGRIGCVPTVMNRKLRASNYFKDWDKTLHIFQAHNSLLSDEKCVRDALHAAISMKRFDTATIILECAQISDRANQDLTTELTRSKAAWTQVALEWDSAVSSNILDSIDSAVSSKNHRVAEAAYWKLFNNGERGIDFFDRACRPLNFETGFADRVMFFRRKAYIAHPTNITYVKNLAQCYLHRQFVDEAYILLETHLRDASNDAGFLALRCLAQNAVIGASTDPMVLGRWDEVAENPVLAFDIVRQANVATWQGKRHVELTAKAALAKFSLGSSVDDILSLARKPSSFLTPKKLKIAICISGQMRAFEKNAQYLIENLINPLHADVFIHTWDKQPHVSPELRHLNRFIDANLIASLPAHLRHLAAFANKFPSAMEKLKATSFTEVTEDWVKKIIDSKKIVIESDAKFSELYQVGPRILYQGKENQAKMFYKIHACDNIRRSEEIETGHKYDVVIRMRPDFRLKALNILDFANDCVINSNRIYVDGMRADGVGDMFAMGSGDAMHAYSAVWHFILKFQKFDYLPGFVNKPAETLLGQHLSISGLEARSLPIVNAALTADLPIERIDILLELEIDAQRYGEFSEVSDFLNAYRVWRKQNLIQ